MRARKPTISRTNPPLFFVFRTTPFGVFSKEADDDATFVDKGKLADLIVVCVTVYSHDGRSFYSF